MEGRKPVITDKTLQKGQRDEGRQGKTGRGRRGIFMRAACDWLLRYGEEGGTQVKVHMGLK